ncbi:MAG: glutamate synthase subunit beta [Spirochaetia bacterium]|nr:glutamate synthase subunit beta [Spirochaetia bacterium]
MGKITGFMEFKRAYISKAPVEERVRHYKEFEKSFDEETAKVQGARCMDCGIPFCHGETGCPVDNLIPEFNDHVYKGRWKDALESLHSTNNFPEFTGRVCPAPCESACVVGLIDQPIAIKGIERTIIDRGFEEGWVEPRPPQIQTGKKIAIVGSGPAGLAAAQQLARAGHSVTVYEKMDRIGGLLRYGIPDFKLEKWQIDRRKGQMEAEGVVFKTNVEIGKDISGETLRAENDALILAMGSDEPFDLKMPGRDLKNIHFAMEYLVEQNRLNAGDSIENPITAKDKNIIVIGGGDTGSDCVGNSNRQGAKSIIMLRRSDIPPEERPPHTPWPLYPDILWTSTSHEEGVDRKWKINTRGFKGNDKGEVTAIYGNFVEKDKNGKFADVPGTDFEWPADLVFIAMGYRQPIRPGLIEEFVSHGMDLDGQGNIKAPFGIKDGSFETSLSGVYACGDVRRGQSLIVWAISEGRKCAYQVHRNLMYPVKKSRI